MKKKRRRYVIDELKAIFTFAACVSLLMTFGTVGWWWFQPYGTGAAVMFGSFGVGVVLGVLASLWDDYRLRVYVDRRRK